MNVWEFRQAYESHISIEALLVLCGIILIAAIAYRVWYDRRHP